MINEFFIRLGEEAVAHGTVATTFASVAVEEWTPVLEDPAEYLEEARGDGEESHVAQKGLQVQKHTAKGRIYHDTHTLLLCSAFGAPTATDNEDDTEALVFKGLANPRSVSAQWFDGVQGRQNLYNVVDTYGVEFGGEDALVWNAELLGLPETDISTPTASFSAEVPFINWQAAVTIGGVSAGTVLSYALEYNRNVEARHLRGTAGQRAPSRFTYGKRGGSLELLLDFTTQAEYIQAKNLAQRAVVVTFTDTATVIGSGSRNPSISFNVPKAVWSVKEVDLGGSVPALKLVSEKLLAGTDGSVIVTLVTES